MDLWTRTTFTSFSVREELAAIFACALGKLGTFTNATEVINGMLKCLRRTVVKLPDEVSDALLRAIFVRKIEAAGIKQILLGASRVLQF